MFPEGKKRHKSNKSGADIKDSSPEPIDTLVDTIIGYLEKSNAYMRAVANQAFSLLSGSVHETTIDLILSVR